MTSDRFLYVTFIRTTPEKLWAALTNPEFNRRYWFGMRQESAWKKGASWKLVDDGGEAWDAGEILEIDPPRTLVLAWQHQKKSELKAEGFSRATFTIEKAGPLVKLTVLHELEKPVADSKFIGAVSGGWPMVLSSLKTLLETGEALPRPEGYAEQRAR
jgi:uncharacterized protein YndB with AHSA1/START domain